MTKSTTPPTDASAWFKTLKPGDRVVYYQSTFPDEWPHAGVGTVQSNAGGKIVLEEIAGWTFRASDGNPIGYDENPRLCTYIVPTTNTLIRRVTDQQQSITECREQRDWVKRLDWDKVHYSIITKVCEIVPPPLDDNLKFSLQ